MNCKICKKYSECTTEDITNRMHGLNTNNFKDSFVENTEQKVAKDILWIAEQIFLSEEYLEYRCNYGSNGARDLFMQVVKNRYCIE